MANPKLTISCPSCGKPCITGNYPIKGKFGPSGFTCNNCKNRASYEIIDGKVYTYKK